MAGRRALVSTVSPLRTWFPGPRALARFRRLGLGRVPTLLPPRDAAWRAIAPDFPGAVRLATSGLPVQTVAERRYDRSGDRRRLRRALATGATVFLPQVHQVLPRLARLMVALRNRLLGPRREECSFLFLVDGRGRPGMGLHHDGDVDAFWLQLAGRRTVTLGPPVSRGTPEDLDDRLAAGGRPAGWVSLDLPPGSLFYLPPRTPHAVVCRGRSLALSLTWSVARGPAAARVTWDVVGGRAETIPPASRRELWTQVPAVPVVRDRTRRETVLRLPGGRVRAPAPAGRLLRQLAEMPRVALPAGSPRPPWLARLVGLGLLGPRNLPRVVVPDDPASLDGWRFG